MKAPRNTVAKTKVTELIENSDIALSSSEIQAELKGLCDRVTVYRILDRLVDEESVHKIIDMQGVVKYASCRNCGVAHTHDHIHFCCTKCGSVTCIEDSHPSFSIPAIYKVTAVNFTVSGLCQQCS